MGIDKYWKYAEVERIEISDLKAGDSNSFFFSLGG